jgi:hypothetical protein
LISNPKNNVFVGYKILKLGMHDAVLTFNDGNIAKIKVPEHPGMEPGHSTYQEMNSV